jgi:SAM-dependent methyltransferase
MARRLEPAQQALRVGGAVGAHQDSPDARRQMGDRPLDQSPAAGPRRDVAIPELVRQDHVLLGPQREQPLDQLGRTKPRLRRVLELGCNLGLLSTFMLKDAGAAAALAVDRNPLILEAAARAAAAVGAAPVFRALDLDRDPDCEAALAALRPDVVFALSLFHWVGDRARLLAFLGRCDELVYEGHDSTRTEWRRLRAAGFDAITLVATSDRGRAILHCRRRTAG